jgi:hypothetical protein
MGAGWRLAIGKLLACSWGDKEKIIEAAIGFTQARD